MFGSELGAQNTTTMTWWKTQTFYCVWVFPIVSSTIISSVGNTPNQSFFLKVVFESNIRDTPSIGQWTLTITRKRQMSFKFRDSNSYMYILYSLLYIDVRASSKTKKTMIFTSCPNSKTLTMRPFDLLIYIVAMKRYFFPHLIMKLASTYKWHILFFFPETLSNGLI